jgi:serine/threonine protein kinase
LQDENEATIVDDGADGRKRRRQNGLEEEEEVRDENEQEPVVRARAAAAAAAASGKLGRRRYVGASDIGAYELQEKLGEGTFGVVWKGLRRATSGAGAGAGTGAGSSSGDSSSSALRSLTNETGVHIEETEEQEEERLVRTQGLKVRKGDVVALKQIILHNETDGVSSSAKEHLGKMNRRPAE